MGLFSNNKKLCPLCGAPTPRLLPTKVEDMPLCKECAAKIDLPGGTLDTMRVADLETYMACYEENKPLRDAFTETMRRSFGFLSGSLVLDTDHRLLRFGAGDSFVFGPENLKSFRITEDGAVRGQGRRAVLPLQRRAGQSDRHATGHRPLLHGRARLRAHGGDGSPHAPGR